MYRTLIVTPTGQPPMKWYFGLEGEFHMAIDYCMRKQWFHVKGTADRLPDDEFDTDFDEFKAKYESEQRVDRSPSNTISFVGDPAQRVWYMEARECTAAVRWLEQQGYRDSSYEVGIAYTLPPDRLRVAASRFQLAAPHRAAVDSFQRAPITYHDTSASLWVPMSPVTAAFITPPTAPALSPVRLDALTAAAFMMLGLESMRYQEPTAVETIVNIITVTQVTDHWDAGFQELTQELVRYAPYLDNLAYVASALGFDYPGVFDYDVSQPFGEWFGTEVYKTHGPGTTPAPDYVCTHLIEEVIGFFLDTEDQDACARLRTQLAAVPFSPI